MDERPLAPSVEKARTLIGFKGQVTLDEMLDELILGIRDALDKVLLWPPTTWRRTFRTYGRTDLESRVRVRPSTLAFGSI